MIVKDINEATFYLLKGGRLRDARETRGKAGKNKKKGFLFQWIILMDGVHGKWVEQWREDKAIYPLKRFCVERRRLKKAIRKILNE